MMVRASPELIPYMLSGIGSCMCMLVRRSSRRIWSGWSADFRRPILLRDGACVLEGLDALAALVYGSADYAISRGLLMGYHACHNSTSAYLLLILRIKLGKDGI